jgi:thiamine biosynthesis lipoprotein
VGAIILGTVLLWGCQPKQEFVVSGSTMGTTYSVKVVADGPMNTDELKRQIDRRLQEINRSMSTYLPQSEISRFNAWDRVTTPFPVSDDFFHVMTVSTRLYELTQGAWDPTVDPLVTLWGFGRKGQTKRVPDPLDIQKQLGRIGFGFIQLTADRALIKQIPGVRLDLASIAKGYGVDQIAQLLTDRQLSNFLVEIGGEVYATGRRKDGHAWKIGINTPDQAAPRDQVYKVVTLQNKACATSGDYRNFFELNGRRYSHIIDPRSGFPVSNGIVSVTVIAGNCTLADGLATALMVMGHQRGLELVNRLQGVECLFVVQGDGPSWENVTSTGFEIKGG